VDRLFGSNIPWQEDIAFLTILTDFVAKLISINYRVKTREDKFMRAQASLKRDFSEKRRDFFSEGRSPAMLEVQQLVKRVAPTKASVLLLGEPGTGKTLVARIIHELGGRAAGPFAKVNCAALAGELLESELFGHERGAFEGATATKGGLVEEADGGTIFLNEVGELDLPAQAKLLRLLQDREFERLGATRTRKVDIRIITGANKDMARAVAEGLFREDLYYRLNVFPIQLAALRDRRDDIVALLKFFTEKVCREFGHEVRFTPRAIEALNKYSWPGNVTEMENLVERLAIVFGAGLIDADDLAPYIS
jgi:Nif-specific regulatory protein